MFRTDSAQLRANPVPRADAASAATATAMIGESEAFAQARCLLRRYVRARQLPAAEEQRDIEAETLRVRPRYESRRYGNPRYARLARHCADEIRRGADDESEMGVYHDLFQPQREANLRARLDEYTPAGMTVGLFLDD